MTVSAIRTARFVTRQALGSRRSLLPAFRLATSNKELIAGRESDVCIDGFFRSANTFAYQAFREWNPQTRIAHHVHAPVQVLRAAELEVPCAALIRDPAEATASHVIFHDGRVAPRSILAAWIAFYRRVAAVRDAVVICGFDGVLRDPGSVVRALNSRFGTSFREAPFDDDARRRLEDRIRTFEERRQRPGTFTLPSAGKEELKPDAMQAAERLSRLDEARELHSVLLRG